MNGPRKRPLVLGCLVLACLGLTACGASGEAASPSPSLNPSAADDLHYVDPTYGFSLDVDSLFADETMPGTVLPGVPFYMKNWIAADSATHEGQPLDTFGVLVEDLPQPATKAEMRDFMASMADPAQLQGEETLRVYDTQRITLAGRPAVLIDIREIDDIARVPVRSRYAVVVTPERNFWLMGQCSPESWRRYLPAFEAMIASFELDEAEQ